MNCDTVSVEECFNPNAKTDKTRKNIKKTLKERLSTVYNITDPSVTNSILKIQGFDVPRYDYISQVENFMLGQLNNDSIDNNANKASNSIARIISEADNVFHKTIGHDMLYRQLKNNVGQEEANRISAMMYDYTLPINDATKILLPYCYSVSGIDLVLSGREGTLKCSPAKHLHSYVSMLAGTVHVLSSNALAGAVAVGSFFFDSARVLLTDGFDLDKIKNDHVSRKYIENMFQQFIYDVNDCSRSTYESPFTNVSVFDRVKLKAMLYDLEWYYEETGYSLDYVMEVILELQNIFCDIIDRGCTETNEPFTFPIVTINIAKRDGKIVDTEFVHDMCQRPIHRYNILVSAGSKVSSCCRLLNDTEMMDMASSVNSFGAALSLGSHRVCVVNLNRLALMSTSIDDFYAKMKDAVKDAGTILRAHKDLLLKLIKSGLQPFMANGTIDINRLFSTFGLIGTWECYRTLERKFGKNENIDIEVMSAFNDYCISRGKELGLIPNIEQIPGEAMAVRMAKADRLIFGKEAVPFNLYSNQTIPLTEKVDVFDRMKMDGRTNLLLTGGGIVHLTITERVTAKQAEMLIHKAVESGCEHFALNLFHSRCKNGCILEGKYEKCPKCGAEIKDYGLRIIGFFRWSSSWSAERQEELEERYAVNVNN